MAEDDSVRVQFDFRGIQVEIVGNRDFVDDMYQHVMRDIEAVRRQVDAVEHPAELPEREELIWVHRCGEMMHKIYMTTPSELDDTLLGDLLDGERLAALYVDKLVFDRSFPTIADDHTIWAELTEQGREKIKGSAS